MRIAIMGAGGIGGYYGGLLARAGNDVTFIARGAHLAAIQQRGLRVKSVHGDFQVHPAQATGDPACDVREAVCVELARLGPKAAAAAPALRKRLGDEAWPVRKAAAEALLSVEQDSKEAVAAVAQAFAADKRPFMKGVFFRILAGREVGPEAKPIAPYAVGQLEQKLADLRKATRDRHQLVRLLSRIGPAAKDAAPALGELLADKGLDAESRKALEGLLKTIGQ